MLSSISSSAHQSAEGFVLPSWGRILDGCSRYFCELKCLWDRVKAACDGWMCPLMSSACFEQSPDYGPWNPPDCCKARACVKGKKPSKLTFFSVNAFILETLCFLLVSSLVVYITDLILCHSSARTFKVSGAHSCHSSGWQLKTFSIF